MGLCMQEESKGYVPIVPFIAQSIHNPILLAAVLKLG